MLQLICAGLSNREIAAQLDLSVNTVAVHRANIMNALGVHKTAELVVYAIQQRPGAPAVNRREFLRACGAAPLGASARRRSRARRRRGAARRVQFVDVTTRPAFSFRHNSGAYGGKLLPETLGAGCAFLDYDADGWQDILLVNGMDWPGHKRQRSTLALYRNNRNGTFTDVTRAAGLDVEMYGMGVAVGDWNNDGFPGRPRHLRRPEPPVPQHREGQFVDVTRAAASAAARPSARPRCGSTSIATACWICSSAITSMDGGHDVFCSLDGKQKSYCTPEAYRGRSAGCSATAIR